MAETKEIEHVYTIPLRKAYQKSMRIRSRYAVDIIRGFLQTHLKAEEIKLGKHLNEAVWERGMKKPPRKIKVTAVKDGALVRAELFGHKYEEFKAMPKKERKGMKEKMLERLGPLAAKKQEEEKMIEGKEVKAETKETSPEQKASATEPISPTSEKNETKPEAPKEKTTVKKGKSAKTSS